MDAIICGSVKRFFFFFDPAEKISFCIVRISLYEAAALFSRINSISEI